MRADAAARSIPPEELRGATITLSNFGMIAGRSPVSSLFRLRWRSLVPERRVVADGSQPAVHRILPLSLAFDHRVVTGGEAARFLAALRSNLAKP
jgi:pyruvate dehydrogenase E2 component (dihydrolipoamide acetyltransferase)